jgi:chromosome segregation ATPase
VQVQELLTAARQDNEGHSARLLTATTQLDELNHACRSYKRQIAAAKETIADGSEWNDKAHEQLQVRSDGDVCCVFVALF